MEDIDDHEEQAIDKLLNPSSPLQSKFIYLKPKSILLPTQMLILFQLLFLRR
jgi:hypothetical protein